LFLTETISIILRLYKFLSGARVLAFLRFGLIILFIGGIFLNPVSADFSDNTSMSQEFAQHELHNQTSKSFTVKAITAQPLPYSALLGKHKHPDKHAHGQEQDDSRFVPLISQRLISFAQHDPLQSKPDYLLAFEFVSPPIPSFSIGYRIELPATLDWPLHVGTSPSRVSGWKESNLLYRFSQVTSFS